MNRAQRASAKRANRERARSAQRFPASRGPSRARLSRLRGHVAEAARRARRDARFLRARQRQSAPRRLRALGARDGALSRRARDASRASSACADADCLIFTRGTTEALNLVARAWGRANVARGRRDRRHRRWSTMPTSSRGSSSRSSAARRSGSVRSRRTGASTSTALRALVEPQDQSRRVQPRVECARHDQLRCARSRRSRSERRRDRRCATARRPRRTCRSASTRSAWTSTRSAATRCAGRWESACCIGRRECSRRCRRTRSGGDMIEFVQRRAHDVERAAAQVRGGNAERRRRGRARRGVRLSRRPSGWTRCSRTSARWCGSRTSALCGDRGSARPRPGADGAERRGELHRRRHPSARPRDDPRRATASAFAPVITARSR